jgi:hypothetical protein
MYLNDQEQIHALDRNQIYVLVLQPQTDNRQSNQQRHAMVTYRGDDYKSASYETALICKGHVG